MTAEEQDRHRRLEWFRAARFGMFVHWGLYSQIGRHEWAMNRERIPLEEYEKLADTFRPLPCPARMWAELAVETGMRYIVMTTKHHEGYCLWDTKLTDYNCCEAWPRAGSGGGVRGSRTSGRAARGPVLQPERLAPPGRPRMPL
ncbi:MAG: hypothetical protein KatS3mg024_2206 [Armatimonadota bacterium]|nr:MAG: hypothetical protein KatS3mg024_2206 [Armatimonadota bacterium]